MTRSLPILCAAVGIGLAGSPGLAAPDAATVAVLPAVEHAGDAAPPGTGAKVTAEIRRRLDAINGVYVVSRAASDAYALAEIAAADAGHELGASLVVTSEVASSEIGYKVSVRLIQSETATVAMGSTWSTRRAAGERDQDEHIEQFAARFAQQVEYKLFPERRPDPDASRAQARAIFLDPTRPEAERMEALRAMTPPRQGLAYPPMYMDGGAALSGEVAIAAAQLAGESDDAGTRVRIWQAMSGVNDTALVGPLLFALDSDPDRMVRVVAAGALVTHVDEPGVRDALEVARHDDPDALVRQAAHEALLAPGELFAELRRKYLDEDRPERDRNRTLYRLAGLNEMHPQAIDDELAGAIVRRAKSSTNASARGSAWSMLSRLLGAEAVDDLRGALATETDAAVREEILGILSAHLDEPGVRGSIRDAQSNDPSPQVRAAAGRFLSSK